MNCDPQGSNDVNVQDGALVHKAPLRPVGRSRASALVSAKDLMTLAGSLDPASSAYLGGEPYD
jgi:hypothetical protein